MDLKDKEKIKDAILKMVAESMSKEPLFMAQQLCEAIEYINNQPMNKKAETDSVTLMGDITVNSVA